jgi:NitT/TauT family transport system permease protein
VHLRTAAGFLGIFGLYLLWEVVTRLELYPAFIIPPPGEVLEKFITVVQDGRLWLHTSTTLGEIALGMLIGVPLGVLTGSLLGKSRALEAALSPVLLAAQSTPIVAYAPVLVIWFGTGITSKVLICALIVFFPMMVNTLSGIRAVSPEHHALMDLYGASPAERYFRLELPSSLGIIMAGLRVSATLAVIGAVVGEFISASAGLGFWIKLARDQYDTALVAVAVLTLAVIARGLYGLVALAERYLLRWRPPQDVRLTP